jgi:hypothetical protein
MKTFCDHQSGNAKNRVTGASSRLGKYRLAPSPPSSNVPIPSNHMVPSVIGIGGTAVSSSLVLCALSLLRREIWLRVS